MGICKTVCVFVDTPGVGEGGSDRKELAKKIAKTIQKPAPKSDPALGEIARVASINGYASDSLSPAPSPPKLKLLDSGDPEVFTKFLAGAPDFALFPHAPRPMYAACLNSSTEHGARMRIFH